MPELIAFDNDIYLREQTRAILKRVEGFGCKLYLEFGGKLFFDHHAARVLPGYDPNVKIRLLHELRDQAQIILCIHAGAIEQKKMRADFGITYDTDALKLIDDLRRWEIELCAVVITRYEDQPGALIFKNKLERRGVPVHTHRPTRGYPTDVDTIVSDRGYGANACIPTTKPLVVVTGPGPGSGKLATCLSQIYHDHANGLTAGYAKFETFPIWNLPLNHPVNIAYEAATADLGDVNMLDPFHMEAYGTATVNYNRDIEAFPIVRKILRHISGRETLYRSPTDMGVNRMSQGIVNDEAARRAAGEEVIRRHFRYASEYAMGFVDKPTVERSTRLLEMLRLNPEDRKVVRPARQAAQEARTSGKGHDDIYCGAAIAMPDGSLITGKNSPLMHAASSLILNAAKQLAGVPDQIHILSPMITESVARLKNDILSSKNASLDLDETLIAMSISATSNPTAQLCLEKLKELRGCDVHMTHMPTPGDEVGLRRLGLHLTTDPNFATNDLYIL
ncbi:MAG: DUF1846 domain-containing protein [Kiritimatiellia bacterium]